MKQFFLNKEQLKLHAAVIDYLVQLRKSEQTTIKRQAPTLIPKKYHILVCLMMTLVITFLNFDELYQKPEEVTEIALLTNYDDIQKKVQYVFEHTIMKYSILYPMKLKQCRSYIPFIPSNTLCSEKSIDLMAKIVYSIGYRPNYEQLKYSPQNNTISGEWGPLQILTMTQNRQVQAQQNGLLNGWSVLQFQEMYQKKIKSLEPQFRSKVVDYIENITSNQNSLHKLQKNIKNSLIKIITDGHGQRKSLSERILTKINRGFDMLLMFLQLDPLLEPEKETQRNEFSPEDATDYYKEEIFIEKEQQVAETQVSQMKKTAPSQGQQNHGQEIEIDKKTEIQAYNSDQMREKYNALLKKVK